MHFSCGPASIRACFFSSKRAWHGRRGLYVIPCLRNMIIESRWCFARAVSFSAVGPGHGLAPLLTHSSLLFYVSCRGFSFIHWKR